MFLEKKVSIKKGSAPNRTEIEPFVDKKYRNLVSVVHYPYIGIKAVLANFNNMYLFPVFKAHALENHPKSTVLLSETDTENVDKPTKKESEILKEVDGKKLLL